jgi:hypothetical protein
MKFTAYLLVLAVIALAFPAFAKSYTDIAIVSPAGSDANNCVWHTPFAPPQPPACATGIHAASLLKGPGSKLAYVTGTFHEHVSITVTKANWGSLGSSFDIGKLSTSDNPVFTGGVTFTGDGYAGIRGIQFKNVAGDCITMNGFSATAPLHGNILNETINGCSGHVIALANTDGIEAGYSWFNDSGVGEAIISLVNSPNFNIHEVQLQMLVGKHGQLGAIIKDSPHGIYGVNVDVYVAPTGLDAESSPFMQILQGNKAYTAKICPASDVATDTIASNVTVAPCL